MRLVWFGLLCCCAASAADGAETRPAFEVVSIKPSGANRIVLQAGQPVRSPFFGVRYSGNRVTCNLDLRAIIRQAYGVLDFQIVAPGWASINTYEIAAIAPPGTTKETARLMLQRVLEERFALRFRRETRDLLVLALTVARSGFTGTPAKDEGPSERGSAAGRLWATRTTLDDFAAMLTRPLRAPVVNMTSLPGQYDIDLRWPVDESPDPSAEGLHDALKRTAGLTLEKRKLPYEMLMVDSLLKTPTAN